jgi:DeoR family galactitol utilization operon repressor
MAWLEKFAECGNPGMDILDRKQKIMDLLASDNTISTKKLSSILGVSPVTIRSDLKDLADKGVLMRKYGGAIPQFHTSVMQRQKTMTEEKNRIGREAASMVSDGDTIMIEVGTTIASFCKHLMGKHDLKVVTNSTLVLPYARMNSHMQLIIVGGYFHPFTESFLGPTAVSQLNTFHVKLAFIGCDGFSFEKGLTSHSVESAEITMKMARQAEKTILLADSSKFEKVGFAEFLPIKQIDLIITDTGIGEDAVARGKKEGVTIKTV